MMRKRRYESFRYYDGAGIAAHLTEMASLGWRLVKAGAFYWTYEESEGQDAVYRVVYAADEAQRQGWLAAFAQAGWQLAAEETGRLIFYGERGARPVAVQAASQLSDIGQCMGSLRRGKWMQLVGALIILASEAYGAVREPVRWLADGAGLWLELFWLLVGLEAVLTVADYSLWRRRAAALADAGEELPQPRGAFWFLLARLLPLAAILCWVGARMRQNFMVALVIVLLVVVVLVIGGVTMYLNAHLQLPGGIQIVVTFVGLMVLFPIMTVIYNDFRAWEPVRQLAERIEARPEVPLALAELFAERPIQLGLEREALSSPAASYFNVEQLADYRQYNGRVTQRLTYTIVETPWPFWRDWCLACWAQGGQWQAYELGADMGAAYQVYARGEAPLVEYLFQGEKRIVRVSFSWTPSDEQLAQTARAIYDWQWEGDQDEDKASLGIVLAL